MKASMFIVICIFSLTTSFSQINVDQPYSIGRVTIKRYHFDTLGFSNGVRICFSKFTTGTAESPNTFAGMIIENFVNAGYKHLPSSKHFIFQYNDQNRLDSLVYYSSTDTTWLESTIFPDSIIPLDHISDMDMGAGQITRKNGRYFLKSESTINVFPNTTESPFDNHNIVIYITTAKNKMMLQISKIFINSYPTTSPLYDYVLDSMEIRWSVDSLGNGKFIEPLNTKKPYLKQEKTYQKDLLLSLKIHSDGISVYDMNGRNLSKTDNRWSSRGLFIMKLEDGSMKCDKYLRW